MLAVTVLLPERYSILAGVARYKDQTGQPLQRTLAPRQREVIGVPITQAASIEPGLPVKI